MHILMLSRDMNTGGVSTCTVEFSNCLVKKGHRVTLAAWYGPMCERLDAAVGFRETDFYTKNPGQAVRTLLQLRRFILEEKVDVIHCHWRVNGIYAQLLHWLTGVPFVWTNHLVPIPSDLFHRLATFYGKQAVAISQEGRRFLEEKMRIPPRNITLINNGIPLDRYKRISAESCAALREKYGVKPGEKALVMFARLVEVKGHAFLLDTLPQVKYQPFKLLLTGDGDAAYKAELERKIQQLGLEDRVVFTGNVRPNDILSIADVFVLPSIKEGFPISVLEAIAFRVPVVRTKTGGYQDVADCVDGVDYGDHAALAAALDRALESGPEVQAQVERAYQTLLEKWDLERVMDRYLEVYQA